MKKNKNIIILIILLIIGLFIFYGIKKEGSGASYTGLTSAIGYCNQLDIPECHIYEAQHLVDKYCVVYPEQDPSDCGSGWSDATYVGDYGNPTQEEYTCSYYSDHVKVYLGTNLNGTYYDYCSDSSVLCEYSCATNGHEIKNCNTCSSGVCSDGECVVSDTGSWSISGGQVPDDCGTGSCSSDEVRTYWQCDSETCVYDGVTYSYGDARPDESCQYDSMCGTSCDITYGSCGGVTLDSTPETCHDYAKPKTKTCNGVVSWSVCENDIDNCCSDWIDLGCGSILSYFDIFNSQNVNLDCPADEMAQYKTCGGTTSIGQCVSDSSCGSICSDYTYYCSGLGTLSQNACGDITDLGNCDSGDVCSIGQKSYTTTQSLSTIKSAMCETDTSCSNPSASAGSFSCINGNVELCVSGSWSKVKDCIDYSGYENSCATEGQIYLTESQAKEDCTEQTQTGDIIVTEIELSDDEDNIEFGDSIVVKTQLSTDITKNDVIVEALIQSVNDPKKSSAPIFDENYCDIQSGVTPDWKYRNAEVDLVAGDDMTAHFVFTPEYSGWFDVYVAVSSECGANGDLLGNTIIESFYVDGSNIDCSSCSEWSDWSNSTGQCGTRERTGCPAGCQTTDEKSCEDEVSACPALISEENDEGDCVPSTFGWGIIGLIGFLFVMKMLGGKK